MQKDFVESFNGRLQGECHNGALFTALAQAHFVKVAWRQVATATRR